MTAVLPTTAVGVFEDRESAERAVAELRRSGFRDSDIGFIARNESEVPPTPDAEPATNTAGDAAVAGAVTGGSIGTLAGLAVAAGLIPPLGPVIMGGTLLAVLASAATGATVGGGFGLLMGLGLPEEDATYYQGQLHAGRFLVTVRATERHAEAVEILQRNGALGEGAPLI